MKQRINSLKNHLIKLKMYSEKNEIPSEVLAKILVRSKEYRNNTLQMWELQQQYDQGLIMDDDYQVMMQTLFNNGDVIIRDYLKKDLSEDIEVSDETIQEMEEISKMMDE